MSFPGRGPGFLRLPIAPGFQSSYSWLQSGTVSALVGAGTSPAGELLGLHEVPARAREGESAGKAMTGPAAQPLSTPASANQLGEIQTVMRRIFPAWQPRRRAGSLGTRSWGRQGPIAPGSVVVEGWLCVRYSGQAEFQVFLAFVYICTDNYMADLLIARKINFPFKTCQLGH